jgi:hypothetical protein
MAGSVAACSPDRAPFEALAQARLALECESSEGCVSIGSEDWVTIPGLGDWRSADLGGGGPGAAQYQNGVFTVEVTGQTDGVGPDYADANPDPDQMRFVYTTVSGDSEIVVRVSGFQGMPDAEVGVAIRADVAADAATGAGLLDLFECEGCDPDGHDFQLVRRPGFERIRTSTDAVPQAPLPPEGELWTMPTTGAGGDKDVWFRLQRVGDDFAVARSEDGAVWVPLATPSGGAFEPEDAVIGFFVSAGQGPATNRRATATFDNVYAGELRPRSNRATWVSGTYGRESTGYALRGVNSFYVDAQGRAYKYGPIGEEGNISVFEDGKITKIYAHGNLSGAEQGAITGGGPGGSVFIAGSSHACDPTAYALPACQAAGGADCMDAAVLGWFGAQECAKCGDEIPRVSSCSPSEPCRRCNQIEVRSGDLATWAPLAEAPEDGGPPPPPPLIRFGSDDFDPPLGRVGGMAVGCGNFEECPLYVSDIDNDLIRVVDTFYFEELRTIAFDRPGPMAADQQGNVWVIRGAADYELSDSRFKRIPGNFDVDAQLNDVGVFCYTKDGAQCGEIGTYDEVSNPDGVLNPSALGIDPRANEHHLLVAENGGGAENDGSGGQNIRIYDIEDSPPALLTTFGQPGGIFSGESGRVFDASNGGHARFYAPSGVGMDGSGNLYVASGLDVDIRKFTATGDLTWNATASKNVFGFGQYERYVAFDPETHDGIIDVFSIREHFTFDTNLNGPGSEWQFKGVTWNPFLHPERNEHGETRRREGTPVVRRLGNPPARFLYALSNRDPDPDGSYGPRGTRTWLNIYRFEGDVAVPCGAISIETMCSLGFNGPDGAIDDVDRCNANPPGSAEPCACNIEAAEGVIFNYPVMKVWTDRLTRNGVVDAGEESSTVDPLDCSQPATDDPPSHCGTDPGDPQYSCPVAENTVCQQVTDAEEANPAPPASSFLSFDVDAAGNLWLVFGNKFDPKIWKLAGSIQNGVPVYGLDTSSGAREIYDTPPPLDCDYDARTVQELRFDASGVAYMHSTLEQTAAGNAQNPNRPILRPAKVISRLPGWPESPAGDCEEPGAGWDRRLPEPTLPIAGNPNYSTAFVSGTDDPTRPGDHDGGASWHGWQAFDVAGDKIFVGERWGPIHVFDAADGNEIDQLFAGADVSGFQSWDDSPMGLQAFFHAAGNEYLVTTAEATSRARTLVFRWTPPAVVGSSCSVDTDCAEGEYCNVGSCAERPCDPSASFETPVPAFTGTTTADGLTFSHDGLTAYLSRKASSNYDLYVASRTSTSDPFGSLGLLDGVNTSSDERAPFLSQDGLKLYLTKTAGYTDVAVASRSAVTEAFGSAQSISAVNSSVHDQDPFFVWDQQALYFASERPSGANRDLYVSTLSSGVFSTPGILDVVNSSSDEDYRPVLSSDGLTLYFASTRQGIGGDTSGDIWIATRAAIADDFGTPTNLWSLNTSGIDHPVALSADKCTLYLASNRETGGGGTQSFRLYQATRGAEVLEEVTVSLNLVGSGSVTTSPFSCTNNAGTCSAQGAPDTTVHLWASGSAYWSGSCTGHAGNPSGDGVLVFTNNGVCTVTFQ